MHPEGNSNEPDLPACGPYLFAVLPSTALGGGIERYSEAVLKALEARGIEVERIAFNTGHGTGPARKLRFFVRLYRTGHDHPGTEPVTVLVFHPSLAWAAKFALLLARTPRAETIVFFYGQEIWGVSKLGRRLIRGTQTRLVTISAFSAGALASLGIARLLQPGLDPVWWNLLVSAPQLNRGPDPSWHLLSVFRLDAASAKGAYTLLEACDELIARGLPLSLRLAGSGSASKTLRAEIAKRDWARVVESPSDPDLAHMYAWADLFVLATRTSTAEPLSVEGFGIVLAEAQVAGVPVVGPAFGGASSAYLDGVTGVAPIDESVGSLSALLEHILSDPQTLRRMAENAAAWARQRYDPSDYADRVVSVLFDTPGSPCLEQTLCPVANIDPSAATRDQ